jgi:uncharacterized protein
MTDSDASKPAVSIRAEDDRLVAVLEDGTPAGYAHFRREGSTYTFDHTVVEPDHEGEGIGGRLATGVMEFVRERGGTVVPECSFIHGYMRKHPETHDLLAEGASAS